jgi:hypothetical protein
MVLNALTITSLRLIYGMVSIFGSLDLSCACERRELTKKKTISVVYFDFMMDSFIFKIVVY